MTCRLREPAGRRAFLVHVPHEPVNPLGDFRRIIRFSALLADVCRHIFDDDNLSTGPCNELGFSLFEPAFAEGAAIRNHSTHYYMICGMVNKTKDESGRAGIII